MAFAVKTKLTAHEFQPQSEPGTEESTQPPS